jgi:hypothetical protein
MPHYSVPPTQQYEQRLRDSEALLAQLERSHAHIGNLRLGLAALFLITAWLCFGPYAFPRLWPLLPAAAFIALVLYHHRVLGLRTRARRAVEFYRAGLDRIRDRWHGSGPAGGQFDVPHHIYAADLDLFGNGSLFQLLCAARTPLGEKTLAQWLTESNWRPSRRLR